MRVGNDAVNQVQHDGYGSVVLGATQMFVDERLPKMGDEALFRRLEMLGRQAARYAFEPDAGLWEFRGRQHTHTYSAVLCWAACDRLGRIAGRLGLAREKAEWTAEAARIRDRILRRILERGAAGDRRRLGPAPARRQRAAAARDSASSTPTTRVSSRRSTSSARN